jgi:hypothetical protein
MANGEKTYTLRHTPDGLTLVRNREGDHLAVEEEGDAIPALSELQAPRWTHWYQRKLARPWQATLLSMNIEPMKKARQVLRTQDDERYRVFQDRLDILQTLMGIEIGLYENHVREGDGANEKYIELAEYCRYAESLGWADMVAMRKGLRLDDAPPVLKQPKRKENNLLRVLDSFFLCAVPDYLNNKRQRSPAAVQTWFRKQAEVPDVSESTLRDWLKQMEELETEAAEKKSLSA